MAVMLPLVLIVLGALGFLASAAGSGGIMPSWVKPAADGEGLAFAGEVSVTVAQDGSGNYTSIVAALAAAPKSKTRYTVRIREGTYVEQLNITRHNVTLWGDGMGKTVITGNRGSPDKNYMLSSATVTALGRGFMARDLTIQNTAGVDGNQSLALRSNSQHTVLYRCGLDGFQDTLYAENKRQFYLDCDISGTVDLIFGDAKAVFQGCRLLVRRPKEGAHNVITAQGRDRPGYVQSGFSFQNCSVIAMPNENLTGVETYLGRPWRNHSHVIFMESFLDGIVHPSGWVHWDKNNPRFGDEKTVGYMEYNNRGPGANTTGRINWEGFSVPDAKKAEEYTVDRFINGSWWLPKELNYNHGL
ncbi:pectinesterase-like isoform X2 [Oryza brachyantha]|uniref:pectinesterase n=1 Tax=Oryza brachyantha TaxID=4533 RepID=J3N9D6_ORYBR|nr:pectinesterase-like isoform X2 [Oryza brachyantha]